MAARNTKLRSNRIDVAFDVYRNISINNIERVEQRDSSVAPTFRNIHPNHKIQQWQQFLKGSANKRALIPFLAAEWKKEYNREQLHGREMNVAYDEECWKIVENETNCLNRLCTNQEEVDTRMFLHVKDAEREGYDGGSNCLWRHRCVCPCCLCG